MLQVGIQLYSVRNHMAKDWLKTLKEVADVGFRYIEPANHSVPDDDGIGFGVSASEMKKILEDTGLKVCNIHLHPLNTEETVNYLPRALEYQLSIGNKRATCAMSTFSSVDDVKRQCDIFNRMGEICNRYGMDFMYHNHYHEFQVFPGETDTVFDLMLKNTDPKLVKFELDAYWAARGAQDVPTFIRKLGSRLLMLHQKDFPAACPQPLDLVTPVNEKGIIVDMDYYESTHMPASFAEVGTGVLDIQANIDAALDSTPCDYIVLEQDFTALDEIESIRVSMDGFKKFTGVKW